MHVGRKRHVGVGVVACEMGEGEWWGADMEEGEGQGEVEGEDGGSWCEEGVG